MRLYLEQLERVSEKIQVAAQRHTWLLVSVVTVCYSVVTLRLCLIKPLWYDELLTFYLTDTTKNLSEFWEAMKTGPDLSPPLYHLAVRVLRGWLGNGPVPLRLPSVVGYWVLSLCVFWLMARRLGPFYGGTALLILLNSEVYRYAYEARPYGLLLGFSGLALVFWHAATEKRSDWAALTGLAGALALGIASHFHAVLLFVPLALGELVRSVSRRLVDFRIWIAFLAGTTPLLPLKPLIEHGRSRIPTYYSHVKWTFFSYTYEDLLTRTITPLVLGASFLALMCVRHRNSGSNEDKPQEVFPLHELVMMVGLALLPILGVVFAKLVTGSAFTSRYVLTAVAGIAMLLTFFAYRLSQGRALCGLCLMLIFLGWGCLLIRREFSIERKAFSTQEKLVEILATEGSPGMPIAIADAHNYLQSYYYSNSVLQHRLHYVSGVGKETVDTELQALQPLVAMNLVKLPAMLRLNKQFLLHSGSKDKLISALLEPESGAIVRLLKPDLFLIDVGDDGVKPKDHGATRGN